MKINKKFTLAFILFVLLPYLVYFNLPQEKSYRIILLLMLAIPVISSFYILYDNHYSKDKSRFWHIVSLVFGLVTLLYFLILGLIVNVNFSLFM